MKVSEIKSSSPKDDYHQQEFICLGTGGKGRFLKGKKLGEEM